LGEEGERVKNGEGGESGIQEVLTEVKTERGDEAKERRRKQEGILEKARPGKNFSEKILWIENLSLCLQC
jgi:hypothetical protein